MYNQPCVALAAAAGACSSPRHRHRHSARRAALTGRPSLLCGGCPHPIPLPFSHPSPIHPLPTAGAHIPSRFPAAIRPPRSPFANCAEGGPLATETTKPLVPKHHAMHNEALIAPALCPQHAPTTRLSKPLHADAWCWRRPAGHHRGAQASSPNAPAMIATPPLLPITTRRPHGIAGVPAPPSAALRDNRMPAASGGPIRTSLLFLRI